MQEALLIATALVAIFVAIKYFRQKADIRLLAESLENRTGILTPTRTFGAGSGSWRQLVRELNRLIDQIQVLDKQSIGRLNQIQATLGNLQEGVLIIDRDNYVLLANAAILKHFPQATECEGKRVERSFHSPGFLGFVREVKRGQGEVQRELVFSDGDDKRWMEVSAAALYETEEGREPWYLFVLHDITKLKALEAIRKKFVANASHELKTPVSVIKGYAETLLTDQAIMDPADRERFLRTIFRHSERLAALIGDLLSLSRLESDSTSLDRTGIDLSNFIREVGSEYQAALSSEGRALVISLGESLASHASVDTLKIRQVLDNLIENATKYSPGESTIELGVARRDDAVEVWVSDEGPGVPRRDLTRIFERFYRVDKGRSRETGGTGLGLSIVKHIVESHGGRIWATNKPEGGLRVAFSLPLASLTDLRQSVYLESEGAARRSRRGERIPLD